MEAFLTFGLLILAVLYFLPTIVAAASHKRKTAAIFVLNLLLGWTLLGWVGSLVWAVADERSDAKRDYEPVFLPQQPTAHVPAEASVSLGSAPTWRPLPTPGQRVHLIASRIVRVEPEMTSRSTGEIRAGTDVTVIRTSGGWVWVQSDDGPEGWTQL